MTGIAGSRHFIAGTVIIISKPQDIGRDILLIRQQRDKGHLFF